MKNNFDLYNLSNEIKRALEALGYNEPTKVQKETIPVLMKDKDLMVKSQTGSGKTASFVIPLCEKMIWEENNPQALILSPTRELAIQISEDVKNIGRFKRINGVAIYGKSPFKDQERELKGKTHMVIGTPGRVLDHIERGTLKCEKIKYLVIDEADEMLNMGFIDQVEKIIRKLSRDRVTMLFSATLPEEIKMLCSKYMKDYKEIEVQKETLITDRIAHLMYRPTGNEKLETLNKILIKEMPETAVCFCRTKDNVDLAYDFLKRKGYSVLKIHGGMMQKERTEAMNSFKKGQFRILVATDVAARGIDVEDITHVINIDIPLEKESYVHRIGRTGRQGKKGKAISLVTPYEDKFLKEIHDYVGFTIPEVALDTLKYTEEEKSKALELLKKSPKKKIAKSKNINNNITKLYLNGGKKKKIRALDLVGTISHIAGVVSEDIGIITIEDNGSYVEILNGKGDIVLNELKNKTIKGKKLKVEKARK